MKSIALAILIILTTNLSAKEITLNCDFTEPFISLKVETDTDNIGGAGDQVVFASMGEKSFRTKTISNSIKSDDFTYVFSFKNKERQEFVLTVDLKKAGNNGMSDEVYTSDALLTNSNGLKVFGGCNIQ